MKNLDAEPSMCILSPRSSIMTSSCVPATPKSALLPILRMALPSVIPFQTDLFLSYGFVQSNTFPLVSRPAYSVSVSLEPTVHYLGASSIISVIGLLQFDAEAKCCVGYVCRALLFYMNSHYICDPITISSLKVGLNYVTILAWGSTSDFEVLLKRACL